jgi:glucose-6-phosphate dehydrogenase assembly protein OpcA
VADPVATEAEATTTTVAPRPVDVAAIERELDGLLFEPPPDSNEPQPVGIRARMSNLLIYAPTQADASRIGTAVDAIAERHPSRILMLVADAPAGEEIGAYVSAVCHLGEGRRQVCSEHVTVYAAGHAVRRLASIARSLVIGDLPTSVWWAAPVPPPLGGEVMEELRAMSAEVIFDSVLFADPVRGLDATAEWVAGASRRIGVTDLAWSRLAPWRTFAAQALDPAGLPGALAAAREVTIEHGAGALAEAVLFAGWLADRLGWQPAAAGARAPGGAAVRSGGAGWSLRGPSGEVRIGFAASAAAAAAGAAAADGVAAREGIARVAWSWGTPDGGRDRDEQGGAASGSSGRVTLAALDASRLAVLGDDGTPRCVTSSPVRGEGHLVARALSELRGDRAYRRVLEVVRSLGRGG